MRQPLTVNQRFGHVFLHVAGRTIAGYPTSKVLRLRPEEADSLAHKILDCARRARKEPKAKLKLMR